MAFFQTFIYGSDTSFNKYTWFYGKNGTSTLILNWLLDLRAKV